jgi:hypothetical protein
MACFYAKLKNNLSKLIFASLLIAIVLSAHPFGPLQRPAEALWRPLALMGLDISMTPFTSDMALMVDPGTGRQLGVRNMFIEYSLGGTEQRAQWPDLEFYRFRLPALLFVDLHANGFVSLGHVRTLCRYLTSKFGEVEAFNLKLDPMMPQDSSMGLNKWWRCERS